MTTRTSVMYCRECHMDIDLRGGSYRDSRTCQECAEGLRPIDKICGCGRVLQAGEFRRAAIRDLQICVSCTLVTIRDRFKDVAAEADEYPLLVYLERRLEACQSSQDVRVHEQAKRAFSSWLKVARGVPAHVCESVS